MAAPDQSELEAVWSRAVTAWQQGELATCAELCTALLALVPDHDGALHMLGMAHTRRKQWPEAEAAFARLAALDPTRPQVQFLLGAARYYQKRLPGAAAAFRVAVSQQPGSAMLHNQLGIVLKELGRFAEAAASYLAALRLEPHNPEYHYNLANLHYASGDYPAAVAGFRQAVELRPGFGAAWDNLGSVLQLLKRLDEAELCFLEALKREPGSLKLRSQLLYLRQRQCSWEGFAELAAEVRSRVAAGEAGVSPFSFLALESSPGEQLRCASMAAAELEPHATPVGRGRRRGDSRLRIGYLSGDFREHAVARLIVNVFECHDRDRFVITGYSNCPDAPSPLRERIRGALDRMVDIHRLSHQEAARVIAEDGTDILVDLAAYTRLGRPEVLPWRPAPIQVNFLGYPGTMGGEWVDYLLADRFIVPPGLAEFYSERVVYLPDCYQPNDGNRRAAEPPPSRAACGLPERGVVFCSFNNSYKITPELFAVWLELLRRTPESVLWLLETTAVTAANLRRAARAGGVAEERIRFAPKVGVEEHLARHCHADLFLDTFPYNAHTTASEALWMGVPVVTRCGEGFASRVAGSLLHAVGLPELITTDVEGYRALALRLAHAPGELAALGQRLRAARDTSPLFDPHRFTRNLEQAFVWMWEQGGKVG